MKEVKVRKLESDVELVHGGGRWSTSNISFVEDGVSTLLMADSDSKFGLLEEFCRGL